MQHFSKSLSIKKQTHLHLWWPEGEYMFSKCSSAVICRFEFCWITGHLPAMLLLLLRPLLSLAASLLPFVYGTSSETWNDQINYDNTLQRQLTGKVWLLLITFLIELTQWKHVMFKPTKNSLLSKWLIFEWTRVFNKKKIISKHTSFWHATYTFYDTTVKHNINKLRNVMWSIIHKLNSKETGKTSNGTFKQMFEIVNNQINIFIINKSNWFQSHII